MYTMEFAMLYIIFIYYNAILHLAWQSRERHIDQTKIAKESPNFDPTITLRFPDESIRSIYLYSSGLLHLHGFNCKAAPVAIK